MIVCDTEGRMNGWSPIGWRSLACALGAVLMLFCPVWAGEKHSGTLVSSDKNASTIVVGEVGPWRVSQGRTEVTNRTFRVTDETRFVLAERRAEGGSLGWPGGFVDVPLAAWDVKVGDFVTVDAKRAGGGLVALVITVVRP